MVWNSPWTSTLSRPTSHPPTSRSPLTAPPHTSKVYLSRPAGYQPSNRWHCCKYPRINGKWQRWREWKFSRVSVGVVQFFDVLHEKKCGLVMGHSGFTCSCRQPTAKSCPLTNQISIPTPYVLACAGTQPTPTQQPTWQQWSPAAAPTSTAAFTENHRLSPECWSLKILMWSYVLSVPC